MPVHPTPLTPDTAPASPGSPVRAAAEANLLAMQQAATERETERQRAIAEANAAVNAPPSPPGLDAEHTHEGVSSNDDAPPPTVTDVDPPETEEEARPDLAGKRVVLFREKGTDGWHVIAVRSIIGSDAEPEPVLYDGARDDAIRAALDDEHNGPIADRVRAAPEDYLLVSVPASSWAPAPVKPKVTKTTWVVVR